MSSHFFQAPSLEALAVLLPAYDFESFIAQGGMGAVYKARQRSLDRDVAIKILPRELGADPDFRRSFATEARAMARLNHPNLIGVYDSGDVDGMPYIVMEFVNGKSLYHSAYNLAVEPDQAATIVKGICDGLAHAHENGVIHRDIKPANILLTPKTEPKIGDFGLAHAGEGPGVMMGTPGYTAPEVMSHPEHADRRSDLYSVGVILYELLTGHQPPLEGPIPPPSSICGCDAALDQICLKAMNVNALLRYQDAHEMSVALDSWLRRIASTPRLSPQEHRGQSVVPRGGPVVITTQSSGGMAKNLVIAAVVVAAVVVVAGAIGYQKFKSGGEEAKTVGKPPEMADKPAKDDGDNIRKEKEQAGVASADPFANETPLDSLERLKSSLVSGKREKMPKGSFVQHGAFTLPIPTPMTWQQASAFAESHGGYLATTLSDDDLQTFSKLLKDIPGALRLWTGAGKSGRDTWTLIDGSKWNAPKAPVGAGEFAAVDELGILRAMGDTEKQPFLIQWRADGSNPGTLEANLERTAASLSSGEPVYPPGTWASGSRHVLSVYHSCPEAEAWQLAKSGGGHLAVTSGKDEGGWLVDQVAKLQGTAGFWIGAVRKDDAWNWMTRETWDTTFWADGFPKDDGTAIVIVPGKGWENVDPGAKPDGFIIEWSNDRDSAPKTSATSDEAATSADTTSETHTEITGPTLDLHSKAKTLMSREEAERQKALAANAETFKWGLDTWLRTLSKTEALRWKPDVEKLKAKVQGNRVPAAGVATIAKNLLPNPDFSQVASNKPVGWTDLRTYSGEHEGVKVAASTGGRENSTCLNVSSQKVTDSGVGVVIKIKSHTRYRLAGWVRTEKLQPAGSSPGAMLNINSGAGTQGLKGNNPWTELSVDFDSEGRTEVLVHCLFGGYGGATGSAWYDDVSLTELAEGASGNDRMSAEMAEISKRCADKQAAIDAEFKGKAGAIRDAYVKNLEKARAAASSADAAGCAAAIQEASDLDRWLAALASGGSDGASPGNSSTSKEVDPIVGVWTFQNGFKVTIGADKSVKISTGTATWELVSGNSKKRSYEFHWPNGTWDKLDMSSDGHALDGLNSSSERSGGTKDGTPQSTNPTNSKPVNDIDPIVGHWTFQNGIKVNIRADHKVDNSRQVGDWSLVSGSSKTRRYEFHWKDNGWDKLELSGEGRVLEGTNSFTAGGGGPSGGIKNDTDPAHPWETDPIVGDWIFNGGGNIKISGDGTASYPGASGTWTLISGDTLTRTYRIWWGKDWDVVTLSSDGKRLQGTNAKGPSHASRAGS